MLKEGTQETKITTLTPAGEKLAAYRLLLEQILKETTGSLPPLEVAIPRRDLAGEMGAALALPFSLDDLENVDCNSSSALRMRHIGIGREYLMRFGQDLNDSQPSTVIIAHAFLRLQ